VLASLKGGGDAGIGGGIEQPRIESVVDFPANDGIRDINDVGYIFPIVCNEAITDSEDVHKLSIKHAEI
jgi:hypothetical protein